MEVSRFRKELRLSAVCITRLPHRDRQKYEKYVVGNSRPGAENICWRRKRMDTTCFFGTPQSKIGIIAEVGPPCAAFGRQGLRAVPAPLRQTGCRNETAPCGKCSRRGQLKRNPMLT